MTTPTTTLALASCVDCGDDLPLGATATLCVECAPAAEPCESCGQHRPLREMATVTVFVCAATHSSPAEYDDRWICSTCDTPRCDDRSDDRWAI